MTNRANAAPVLLAAALVLVSGCPNPTGTPAGKDEDEVRAAFTAFQAALKARDADKLWSQLDSESQADAERAAKAAKAAYEAASGDEKAQQEKALGLSAAEISALTGKGFLRTKRFQGKYDEVPESKLDKVSVQGNTATVNYVEPDGDKEKFTLVRQDGRWALVVPMPKGS